jgi:hypothetical protein
MKRSFHEDFSRREEVKGSTDRSFGLTVGGILLAIAAARTGLHVWHGAPPSWVEGVLAVIGVLLLGFGLVAPDRLAPLNRAWTALGLLMRATGRDPLHLKFDRQAGSYWVLREPPGPAPQTMSRQF